MSSKLRNNNNNSLLNPQKAICIYKSYNNKQIFVGSPPKPKAAQDVRVNTSTTILNKYIKDII